MAEKKNYQDFIRVVNITSIDTDFQPTKEEKIVIAHRANPVLGNKNIKKKISMTERNKVIKSNLDDIEKDFMSNGPIFNYLTNIAQDIVENQQKIALACFCTPAPCHAENYIPYLVDLCDKIAMKKRKKEKP